MTWDDAYDANRDDGYWTVVEEADVDPIDVADDEPTHEEVQEFFAADPMWLDTSVAKV